MATIKKAQPGVKIKKVVKKVIKKDDGNGANDYKNMKDPSGKKGTMGGEGTNRGPNYNMLKAGGNIKKAQYGISTILSKNPNFSGLKGNTPKDSTDYKKGWNDARTKKHTWFPNKNKLAGFKEGRAGMKTGGTIKKAKTGTSLGMKSVKAGFDNNPGVTRADIITAATKKAKSGASMKKCKYGCK